MTFTVCTNERVLAGAQGKKRRQFTLSFKNIIPRSEIQCFHWLISNTLFLWSNFMVLLQLLGRAVIDCFSFGVCPFGCRRYTGYLCNQGVFGVSWTKNVLAWGAVFSHRAEPLKL